MLQNRLFLVRKNVEKQETPEEYENLKVIGRVYMVDYSFLNKRAFYEPKCRARVDSTLARIADRVRRGEIEDDKGCQVLFAVSSDLDRNVRWETFVEGNETGMQTGMHRAVVYTGMQSALAQVMLVVTYRYNPDTQEVSDIVAKLHSLDPNTKLGGAANFNYQKDRKRLQGSMDAVLQYQDVLGEWHLECFDKEFLIPLNLY